MRSPRSPPLPIPALREREEPDSDHRTPFQRDRDRIVHSKAFRRLKHKTQVFIAPEGDHYRTRLTHTLEACGIARNVARALGLNEDLTEAIGLGHDLGHPPFGHIGEEVLDDCVRARWGHAFRHNEHSLRVVDRIERLNLTEPVRDGILRHTGAGAAGVARGPDRAGGRPDRLHQSRHRRRAARRRADLRRPPAGGDRGAGLHRPGAHRDAGRGPAGALGAGRRHRAGGGASAARCFAYESSCSSASTSAADAQREKPRVERMLRALFDHYAAAPPPPLTEGASDEQRVVDWLAGMTDRFAIRIFSDLYLPAALLMGLFTRDSIDRLRDAIDMVDLVGAKTDLRRVGTRFTGLCPFHDERTPSFSVNAEEKLFYCFGCQAKGDAIGFVEQAEGLDFPEAVEVLADRYGVKLERENDDPAGRGAPQAQGAAALAAHARRALLRELPVGLARGRPGA